MPPPLPRSSTTSPGFSSASAVGLPQPSEARTAASGTVADSLSLYRSEVIGSWWQEAAAGPQHEIPFPASALRAASPYFCRRLHGSHYCQ